MSMLSSYRRPFRASTNLAVRVGFEPTERSHVRLISNQLPSATRPPVHFGSPGWDRTTDQVINSHLLYR